MTHIHKHSYMGGVGRSIVVRGQAWAKITKINKITKAIESWGYGSRGRTPD
jgi:hypothetical protein